MKTNILLLIGTLTVFGMSGCVSSSSVKPNPTQPSVKEDSPAQILSELKALYPFIGGYPPRFKDTSHKQEIEKRWDALATRTDAYAEQNPNDKGALHLIAETYRLGHNLNVPKASTRSSQAIETCISQYPDNIPCHESGMFLYVAAGHPQARKKALRHLTFLENHHAPEVTEDVAFGFMYYFLTEQNLNEAKKRAATYLKHFPNTERAGLAKKVLGVEKLEIKTSKAHD